MYLQRFAREPTEPATPRRLEQAREKGQVYKSTEVIAAATLLAAYLALQWAGPGAWATLARFASDTWSDLLRPDFTLEAARDLSLHVMLVSTLAAAPIALAVLGAGLIANYLQVGALFTLTPITPDFSRIDPLQGLKRLFSRRSVMEGMKALAKVTLIGLIAYQAVAGLVGDLPALIDLTPPALLSKVAGLVSTVIFRVLLVMIALALLDFLYQRYEYGQQMRMTKQEIKEEYKETEGSPEVRQALRRRQREMSRRRMMADVPKADVVVTNPTHFAVALRYEQGQMDAPRVLAKGTGYVALKIREVARAHGVPVVPNPPLARSLYDGVEIGENIPADLFQAVAEVLAFVYRLRSKV